MIQPNWPAMLAALGILWGLVGIALAPLDPRASLIAGAISLAFATMSLLLLLRRGRAS